MRIRKRLFWIGPVEHGHVRGGTHLVTTPGPTGDLGIDTEVRARAVGHPELDRIAVPAAASHPGAARGAIGGCSYPPRAAGVEGDVGPHPVVVISSLQVEPQIAVHLPVITKLNV